MFMANRTNIWNINHNLIKKCTICGGEFRVKWSHAQRRKCCSRKCKDKLQSILLQGENNPKWKGGQFQKEEGYVMIRMGNKYIYEHILTWKRNNGSIPKGHVIHHINGDKSDNRIENLSCMSQSDHMKLHMNTKKKYRHCDYILNSSIYLK